MNKIKKKNNIVSFPNNLTNGEKEVEAIIFAAAEPLDVETIESKVKAEEAEESEVKEETIESKVKAEEAEESEVKEQTIKPETKSIKPKKRIVKDEIIDVEVDTDS